MKQIICHLKNLQCHRSDERDGDELFIEFEGKKIWPEDKKYKKGTDNCVIPINLKLQVKPASTISLKLWDYDLIFNDLLGEFNFTANTEGQFQSDLRTKKSAKHKFTLEFAIYPTVSGLSKTKAIK